MRHLLLFALILVTAAAQAEVTRVDIQRREPYAGGKAHGDRGPYERISGVVHFALDPDLEANRAIVDLPLADRNDEGQVEFWADFEILAPKDLAKSNGAVFYEVNNRGLRKAPNTIDGDADDFLLRQGFIVVWSGWIAEVLPGNDRFLMFAPTAREGSEPIRGIVRQEVIVDAAVPKANLAHRAAQGCYRPSANGLKEATLTMREREADERQTVPRDDWKLVVTDVQHHGRPWPLPLVELELRGGLKPGWIYEAIYEAEGPVVQGVGLAGIRDLIACLKHDTTERNPLRLAGGKPAAKRVIGWGASQSGRCLRQILYEGFNADEKGRIVFDGVIPHIAGGGLGSFNHRFASPTRTNDQHDEHLYAADYFPFTYGDSRDPFTGKTDGILRKCRESKTVPKVFHTQSSSEYWHRSNSLVHTDPLGKEDAEIPPEVRLYTFGGTQHSAGNGVPSPRTTGQLPTNPADYRPLARALVLALDAWIADGTEPPPSVYPKIADGTLVDWRESASGWRAIPGIKYPEVIQTPPLLDRGPHWEGSGIATLEPPKIKDHYVVKVPAYGPDGNERGTLLLPGIQTPVASYTSWNLRHPSIGAPTELLALQGAYIPFTRTRQQREASGDPRPALLERYRDFADYERQYEEAARKLIQQRYLLAEDLPRLMALCEKFRGEFEASAGK